MQEAGTVAGLRAALADAEALNFSKSRLFRLGILPVAPSTMYRWLAGDCEPGAFRLEKTIKALKEFTVAERRRHVVGARTCGGPWTVDAEFLTVSRSGVVVALKEQEYKLFDAIGATRGRPAYLEWLGDVTGLGKSSLHRSACELRKKLIRIDLELKTINGRGGESASYTLSDLAGNGANGAAA